MKPQNIISVKPNSTVFGDQGSWVNEHLLEVLINRGMFSSALKRFRQGGKGVVSGSRAYQYQTVWDQRGGCPHAHYAIWSSVQIRR
ncbi:hypothetical protein CHI95_23165 [Providencia rettgeri]|uniref:Uncharacterized protein n=1 Tax=Providencia rettgeri TaxID=587 RepID=A0A264VLK1_PRORE|nr:hypothetical protein [Providencia rettgeri]ELR5252240.1 hypothetical protein [Providencia rettgeri]OZS72204.1 hypothetical protein CHI95_23165 [Providencia rettgeri]